MRGWSLGCLAVGCAVCARTCPWGGQGYHPGVRRSRSAHRLAACALCVLAGAGAAAAAAEASLPRVRSGRVVAGTSVAGVALGATRAEMVRRWGAPDRCTPVAGRSERICTYSGAQASVRVDLVTTPGQPTLRVLSIGWSSRPIDSPLAGWKTARGIAVGSTWKRYAAAYPRYEFFSGFTGLPTLDVATPVPDGRDGIVRASFNATLKAMRAGSPGRITGMEITRRGIVCTLAAVPAPGPLGEPQRRPHHGLVHRRPGVLLRRCASARSRSAAPSSAPWRRRAPRTRAATSRAGRRSASRTTCAPPGPSISRSAWRRLDPALQVTVLSPQCRHCRPYRLALP